MVGPWTPAPDCLHILMKWAAPDKLLNCFVPLFSGYDRTYLAGLLEHSRVIYMQSPGSYDWHEESALRSYSCC